MADAERRKRGEEMIKKVYAGDVVVPPEGANAFADVMLEQLFAETWTRGGLSLRDRRLLLMGVIAALGEKDTWKIQVRSALKNDELTEEQVHEATIMLAPYAGYPRVAGLLGPTFEAIREAKG
jgi:4-carboxymuconolactone decarboxylase